MAPGRTLIRHAGDPAAILIEGGDRILAAGQPAQIGAVPDARQVHLPDMLVLPALVNAHCHLDLSHLDPEPYGGDFALWLDGIRRRRVVDDELIAAAVRRGIELTRAGGTAIVGDIAGGASEIPARELRAAGIGGVSYLELIGVGNSRCRALETLDAAAAWLPSGPADPGGLSMGLSPHAPYTCDLDLYRRAARIDVPMATHLAETPDEVESIDALAEVLCMRPIIAAHVNYSREEHLDLLARAGTTVVYCPRAAAYFGHSSHGYRRMIRAGINVALGTDGLPCLDTPDRISVLDDMRLLYRRDGADPAMLLHMATVAAASGLGLDAGVVTLAPGPVAGLIALPVDPLDRCDPLAQVLRRDDAPRWVS
ncbi:MAG: amidohydrolase family protein [Planctomycetes bacterium]|nr:amidohydrolase family protein [Planctomycetota bacterium]